MRRALAGLRKYQEAERAPMPAPMPSVAEARGAVLRDYGGVGRPVLFVPSLINPPSVLDLSLHNSLLRWLAGQGHRPLLLDWGPPNEERRNLDLAGHVEDIVLPLMASLGEAPALVGYCLGGTMAIAAAQLTPVPGLVTIAAPWHFAGFPEEARGMLARLWGNARWATAAFGMLPMEVLQSAFWSLDPRRTVSKFERFTDLEGAQAESFIRLEDWANEGAAIPEAAARELFESFFAADLPGSGQWSVAGRIIDPGLLSCPLLNIISTVDRIVPQATAPRTGQRYELALGHVGMIVGSRARGTVWERLSIWLGESTTSI